MSAVAECYLNAHRLHQSAQTGEGVIEILKDVSLSVKKGESLAIQGASGSGKSTLLSLLAGLDLPLSGRVVLAGNDLTLLSEDQRADLRADRVGFVFQAFHLMDELNAIENVALPLELFGQRKANSIALEWLCRLGLEQRLHQFPKQLSGGEQQRVALARAFAIKPDLLFADEPTANLDSVTAKLVLDYLFSLQRELGTTMVIATHDDTLAARCNQVVRLAEGQVAGGSCK